MSDSPSDKPAKVVSGDAGSAAAAALPHMPPHPTPAEAETVNFMQWVAVFGAVLGAFMAILDIQITNAAIRDVTGGLGATIEDGSWISTSYLVAEIIIIPLSGWLTQVFGLKTYIQWTSGLFVLFSILCGLSWNLPSMIVFRALQGITGGALIPLAFQVILSLPVAYRALGQTIFGITATFAPAIGPTLGGYLTDKFHWPIIFFLNLVPGIIQFLTVQFSLEKTKGNFDLIKSVDLPGIISMALGLGALTIFLEEGERKDWFGSHEIVYLGLLALVSLTFFFIHELRTDKPFINLRLLARRNFGIGCITIFALGVALYGALFLLPVYLSSIQNYSSFEIGRTMMWAGFPQLLVLPFLPTLMKKVDLRILTFIGLNLFGISCFMTSRMTHDTGYEQLIASQLVRAIGQPLLMIPLSTLTHRPHRKSSGRIGIGAVQHASKPRRLGGHRYALNSYIDNAARFTLVALARRSRFTVRLFKNG